MGVIGTAITSNSGNLKDTQPIWSPDGSRIAFVSTRDSVLETWQETDDDGNPVTKSTLHINKEVYVMNADGSGQTRLTSELANDDSPSWSPDGAKIVFRSDRERDCCDPSAQVWIMNSDGTGQANISNSGNGDYSASWTNADFLTSPHPYSSSGNQPPVANTGGPYSTQSGQVVQLNGTGSFDPNGTIVSYSWDFGDGTSGTGSIVNHQYDSNGVYSVSLSVSDNNGGTASSEGFVTVGSVALSGKITFDTLPNNTVVSDQYLSQYGVRFYSDNPFYPPRTWQDCGNCSTTSFPNFILTGPNNSGQTIVEFTQPVSNLSFYIIGITVFFDPFAILDVYRNNALYGSFVIFGNGSTTRQISMGTLDNINKIVVRGITDPYGVGFDDFNFTESADVKITNARITASLNGTTQKSLVGANIVLNAAPTPGIYAGGTYSWSFTGVPYSITSGSLTSSSITIRPTDTGTLTAKVTYTLNGATVNPTVAINVILPKLTYFGGQMAPDRVERNMGCSGLFPGATYSLGCRQPNTDDGMVWTATAQIPTTTYLSNPAESGVKFVQAVNVYRKRLTDGNKFCNTTRISPSGEGWQKDTVDPFMHQAHPIHYFADNSYTVGMAEHDAPAAWLDGAIINGQRHSDDVDFIDDRFETYVFYFTTNPSSPNPSQPIFQRAIGFEGSPYPYAAMKWNWGGTATFSYFSIIGDVLYTLQSNTTIGPVSAVGVDSLKPMGTNAANNLWEQCLDSDVTNNPIDASRVYVEELYYDFLQRPPDFDGANFWRGQITQCGFSYSCIAAKRIDVARAFFYSIEFMQAHPALNENLRGTHEYNEAFVFVCYLGFLRRAPNDPPDNNWNGFNFWVTKLDSTNPNTSDYKYNEGLRAFVESIEYRNRFVQ